MKEAILVIEDDLGQQTGYLTPEGILWMLPLWPSGQGNN